MLDQNCLGLLNTLGVNTCLTNCYHFSVPLQRQNNVLDCCCRCCRSWNPFFSTTTLWSDSEKSGSDPTAKPVFHYKLSIHRVCFSVALLLGQWQQSIYQPFAFFCGEWLIMECHYSTAKPWKFINPKSDLGSFALSYAFALVLWNWKQGRERDGSS